MGKELRAEFAALCCEVDDDIVGAGVFHDELSELVVRYWKSCLLKGMMRLLSLLERSWRRWRRSVPASTSLAIAVAARSRNNVAIKILI
jgi:hypothetical protein